MLCMIYFIRMSDEYICIDLTIVKVLICFSLDTQAPPYVYFCFLFVMHWFMVQGILHI